MHVNTKIWLATCGALLFCQCTTDSVTHDTLIPFENAGHLPDRIREGYRMVDLACALPVWEVSVPFRGTYLSKIYNNEIPEDYIEVPMEGAQTGFTVIRLDRDLLAVTTHTELIGEYDTIRVLRRIPGAWQDLTARAFPYALDKESRIRANREKIIVVSEPASSRERRFAWSGSQFVEE